VRRTLAARRRIGQHNRSSRSRGSRSWGAAAPTARTSTPWYAPQALGQRRAEAVGAHRTTRSPMSQRPCIRKRGRLRRAAKKSTARSRPTRWRPTFPLPFPIGSKGNGNGKHLLGDTLAGALARGWGPRSAAFSLQSGTSRHSSNPPKNSRHKLTAIANGVGVRQHIGPFPIPVGITLHSCLVHRGRFAHALKKPITAGKPTPPAIDSAAPNAALVGGGQPSVTNKQSSSRRLHRAQSQLSLNHL
jgi:hypothetical protein